MTSMRKSRLSYAKQNQLIDHFVAGATVRTAAGLCGVSRITVIYFFRRLRQIVELETAPDGRPQYGDSSTIFMVNTAVSTSTE